MILKCFHLCVVCPNCVINRHINFLPRLRHSIHSSSRRTLPMFHTYTIEHSLSRPNLPCDRFLGWHRSLAPRSRHPRRSRARTAISSRSCRPRGLSPRRSTRAVCKSSTHARSLSMTMRGASKARTRLRLACPTFAPRRSAPTLVRAKRLCNLSGSPRAVGRT